MQQDITNPAIHKFLSNKDYKFLTNNTFLKLKEYNASGEVRDSVADIIVAVDPSQIGLDVNINHRLIPQEEATDEAGFTRYKYEATYQVKLNLPWLFCYIFCEVFLVLTLVGVTCYRKTKAQIIYEVRELNAFFGNNEAKYEAPLIESTPIQVIKNLIDKFHSVSIQLNKRHNGRAGFELVDEYDVQDMFHALLALHFNDIRAEEFTPSCAGTSSKIDFILKNEQIGIEIKKTRAGLERKELKKQLTEDIKSYRSHDDCKTLFFFIYDPEHRIDNPNGFERDMSEVIDGVDMKIFIRPL